MLANIDKISLVRRSAWEFNALCGLPLSPGCGSFPHFPVFCVKQLLTSSLIKIGLHSDLVFVRGTKVVLWPDETDSMTEQVYILGILASVRFLKLEKSPLSFFSFPS